MPLGRISTALNCSFVPLSRTKSAIQSDGDSGHELAALASSIMRQETPTTNSAIELDAVTLKRHFLAMRRHRYCGLMVLGHVEGLEQRIKMPYIRHVRR